MNQSWNTDCSYLIWWRHEIETFSALLAHCAGNSPVKDQWRGALMFSLICALNKHSLGWWFETPTRSLWRHCDKMIVQWSKISENQTGSSLIPKVAYRIGINYFRAPNCRIRLSEDKTVLRRSYDISSSGFPIPLSCISFFGGISNAIFENPPKYLVHILKDKCIIQSWNFEISKFQELLDLY